jgi:FtsP/CotA-like multicopper oxidase with cupredoxin domain
MNRREFLGLLVASALSGVSASAPDITSSSDSSSTLARSKIPEPPPDFSLRIAPVKVDLSPGHAITTVGYNGTVPGSLLRVKEGQHVTIDVRNDSDVPELVHWHGLMVPSNVDGAMEEGTPMVPAGGRARYSFAARPSGTRWYHTHAIAGKDLRRSLYSGQYGFFYIEPKTDSGGYDQEIFIAMHHWEPYFVSMQDIRKGPPPNNGLEVMYRSASFNDKALCYGEPIRVKEGQRVIFRILNASATDEVSVALPRHGFEVVALDGNPVPSPRSVPILTIAPAERVDAIVEMNSPGVWVFGSIDDDERAKGMGVVVEYAGRRGGPQWAKPQDVKWDYATFAGNAAIESPDHTFHLVFEKIPGGRGGFNRWTINGKSFPDTDPLPVEQGKRYRLILDNKSGDAHPIHLHRHTFELTKVAGKGTSGVLKDVINVPRYQTAEVDFAADDPGLTLFHCHMQLHQDFGFMTLVKYVQ